MEISFLFLFGVAVSAPLNEIGDLRKACGIVAKLLVKISSFVASVVLEHRSHSVENAWIDWYGQPLRL